MTGSIGGRGNLDPAQLQQAMQIGQQGRTSEAGQKQLPKGWSVGSDGLLQFAKTSQPKSSLVAQAKDAFLPKRLHHPKAQQVQKKIIKMELDKPEGTGKKTAAFAIGVLALGVIFPPLGAAAFIVGGCALAYGAFKYSTKE